MYNINLNLSLFVQLYINNSDTLITLLVDTGADISLIKANFIPSYWINRQETIDLIGIGKGKIRSIGTTSFRVRFKNYMIPHVFHVVQEDFPIPCDGIFGIDFMRKYNSILDFDKDKITLSYAHIIFHNK